MDKVCIDQMNIQADLQCLPVFLAGCNILLAVSGSTYTSRLWCCVELFVYVAMLVEDATRKAPIVLTIGADDNEHEHVRHAWRHFDAAACECFDEEDKKRIFAVVECFPGGVPEFNSHVKILAASCFGARAHRFGLAQTLIAPRAPALARHKLASVIGRESSGRMENSYSSLVEDDDIVASPSTRDDEANVDFGTNADVDDGIVASRPLVRHSFSSVCSGEIVAQVPP